MKTLAKLSTVAIVTLGGAQAQFFKSRLRNLEQTGAGDVQITIPQLPDFNGQVAEASNITNVTASTEAAYCPNWDLILGAEGGSLDSIIAPNCSAFRQVAQELQQNVTLQQSEIMYQLLLQDSVGIINSGDYVADQETYLLNLMSGNQTVSADQGADQSSQNATQGFDQAALDAYFGRLTWQGYQSFKSELSDDYRLFVLENNLRLAKKYLRSLVKEQEQLVDYAVNLYHNQELLEWAVIRQEQRLGALESSVAQLQNQTAGASNSTSGASDNGSAASNSGSSGSDSGSGAADSGAGGNSAGSNGDQSANGGSR